MARRKSRNRRGRFLKSSSRSRSSRKRRSSPRRRRSRASSKPRRRRSRASNPRRSYARRARRSSPRRRRSRASNPRRSRIRHVHHRARRKNPPYTIKTVIIAVAVTGAGFAAAKLIPYAVAHFTGDPSWNQEWTGVGLHAGASVAVAGIAYGVTRLISSKRTAAMVGGELLVGGILATGFEAFHMVRKHMGVAATPSGSLPPLVKAGQAGVGRITPQEIAQAQNAARIIQQRGMGNVTPQQFAGANQHAQALFSPNEKF
jgi:hypothetical protein